MRWRSAMNNRVQYQQFDITIRTNLMELIRGLTWFGKYKTLRTGGT